MKRTPPVEKVSVNADEYIEAIGFAVYTFLTGKIVKRDLYKGGAERRLGEYIEHTVRGKLAEIAFKKFLERRFGIKSLLDLDLPVLIKGEYLPDIVAFKDDSEDWIIPRFWIDVKAVTEEQKWALVRASSLRGSKKEAPRPYDAYVSARVSLPKDHIGRLIKHAPAIRSRMTKQWCIRLADLEEVGVEILGFALYTDMKLILRVGEGTEGAERCFQRLEDYTEGSEPLEKEDDIRDAERQLNSVFGHGGWAFIKKEGQLWHPETGEKLGVKLRADNCCIALSRLRHEWERLVKLLKKNRCLALRSSRAQNHLEREMRKALTALSKHEKVSWFSRALNSRQSTLLDLSQ